MRAASLVLWMFLSAAAPALAEPLFRLAREDGRGWVGPGELGGKPAVFLFWDTECTPCLQELTHLKILESVFPNAAFVIVSLSPRDDTRRVLAKIRLPERIVRARAPGDPRGLLSGLGNRSGTLPFSAFFNRDGSLCMHELGPLTQNALAQAANTCR
jgi:thiol-disulfide isomerase/thioredoxin